MNGLASSTQLAELTVLAREHDLLATGASTGLVLRDATGAMISANPAAVAILGLSLAEMRASHLPSQVWGLIDAEGAFLPADQFPTMVALRTGDPVRGVVVGLHRSGADRVGEHVWLDVSAEPLYRSDDEAPYAVLTSFVELSGPPADRLRLAESERLYRLLAENSTDMIAVHHLDTTFMWVSAASRAVLGHEPEALLGVVALDLIHPDDLERAKSSLAATIHGDTRQCVTVRFRHADGRYVWVEATGRVVPDAAGRPLTVQTVIRDATDRVAAEQERDLALQRFQIALEHAPIGMAIVRPDGRWLEVNSALCSMLDYSAEQLLAMTFREVTHPEDREESGALYRRFLAGEIDSRTLEKRYLRRDGAAVWANQTVALVRHPDGAPAYFLIQIQDVTERKRAQAELASRGLTDPATGLPNRLVLIDRLTHALAIARRDGSRVGVLVIDLDRFKEINDEVGSDVGDEVLRQVSARLAGTLADEDSAVRLGGDSFVILHEGVGDAADVHALADRLRGVLEGPYQVGVAEVDVSVSIGMAVGAGPTAEALIGQADASMRRAKRDGRGRVDVYDEAAQALAMDVVSLNQELHAALEHDQLVVYYQPLVELATGRVVAREALLRWAHPGRGLLSPAAFLAAAEESRLIVAIGTWVLRSACAEAAGWKDEAVVHVNISNRQLAERDFVDTVRDALARGKLTASRLCIEITETSVLDASPSTLRSTRDLHDLGVTLALDDFGTGQSSISALHVLPIQALKIDRAFVAELPHEPTASNLVDGLIHLGACLGLDVIAEGIETESQAQWLISHRCQYGQGYLYGRAEPMA